MQDPIVSGNLTKVKAQTQTHFIVVFYRIDIFHFGMDKFKGGFGIPMKQ